MLDNGRKKKLFMSAALQKMQILPHFVSTGISVAAVLACTLFFSCIPVTKPAHVPSWMVNQRGK